MIFNSQLQKYTPRDSVCLAFSSTVTFLEHCRQPKLLSQSGTIMSRGIDFTESKWNHQNRFLELTLLTDPFQSSRQHFLSTHSNQQVNDESSQLCQTCNK